MVIHHILDIELRTADFGSEQAKTREERERWLQWTMLGYDELAKLYQRPYGDRAMVLKSIQQVMGACGFVPSLGPFVQLPSLHAASQDALAHLYSPEFGLYYALSLAYQRQGYATEATQALPWILREKRGARGGTVLPLWQSRPRTLPTADRRRRNAPPS